MNSEYWSLLAVSFFWFWVAAFITFIVKAFPGQGVFQARPAIIWGVSSAICAFICMLGLLSA